MNTYTDKLYENIIVPFAKESSCLKIISGYASSTFLNKVKTEFPHLQIDLFLGMTYQGISRQDHNRYSTWSKEDDKIKVFYQIHPVPNHMKIVCFRSPIKKHTYIGSANFSENGFLYQREIMTEIHDDIEELFKIQHENSIICTEKDVETFINIYDATYDRLLIEEQQIFEEPEKLSLEDEQQNLQNYFYLDSEFRQNSLNKKNEFSIEVVLPQAQNRHWDVNGINAWRQNETPHLIQTPKVMFDKYFPYERMFEIYTDDGIKLKAIVKGKFNSRKLYSENVNIYKYVCKRIGLKNNAPISHENLLAYGRTSMLFKRIDNKTYLMDFRIE